ncbi:sensor histidine kinase [Catellatospora bangladeshensis]
MAELLENATSFAPPHTRVRVFAEPVGQGLALHIEDRGLGMSDTELAEANTRLAEPPAFDPAQSSRLGLLVVARLAVRQGISVRLRASSYGGITAVVLIPADLVLADTADKGEPLGIFAPAPPAPSRPRPPRRWSRRRPSTWPSAARTRPPPCCPSGCAAPRPRRPSPRRPPSRSPRPSPPRCPGPAAPTRSGR